MPGWDFLASCVLNAKASSRRSRHYLAFGLAADISTNMPYTLEDAMIPVDALLGSCVQEPK